jgi:hypothetical protein
MRRRHSVIPSRRGNPPLWRKKPLRRDGMSRLEIGQGLKSGYRMLVTPRGQHHLLRHGRDDNASTLASSLGAEDSATVRQDEMGPQPGAPHSLWRTFRLSHPSQHLLTDVWSRRVALQRFHDIVTAGGMCSAEWKRSPRRRLIFALSKTDNQPAAWLRWMPTHSPWRFNRS